MTSRKSQIISGQIPTGGGTRRRIIRRRRRRRCKIIRVIMTIIAARSSRVLSRYHCAAVLRPPTMVWALDRYPYQPSTADFKKVWDYITFPANSQCRYSRICPSSLQDALKRTRGLPSALQPPRNNKFQFFQISQIRRPQKSKSSPRTFDSSCTASDHNYSAGSPTVGWRTEPSLAASALRLRGQRHLRSSKLLEPREGEPRQPKKAS